MMINVNINTSSLVKYQDLIGGEVYFSFKDTVFPKIKKEKWSDFIVWVLTNWNEALEKMKNSSDETAFQLKFFNGPFSANVININGLLKFQLLQEIYDKTKIVCECECYLLEFEKSLKDATKELLIELEKRNWISKHTEELSHYITV
ncbi:hypothetical protein [Lysinibacillus agricola]|uniref:hypothetical protein n=1 Tax=Lysinibacillus agricola TaxID=2590012 RepID=UPI003C15DFB4